MNNPFVVGQSLGRYELLLRLGTGGMAQVWAARLLGTRGFQKIVAIKTILTDAVDHARIERMFLEEATIASQIHHPNVVSTLELGEHEDLLYLVMDWVHGEPLNVVLQTAAKSGGLPLPVAVNLIAQVGRGLHSAHDLRDETGELLGVVHRDISAQNVLVAYDGTAKLVDFGIAKVTARVSGALTQEGEVKGKFAYMAPEQVSGQPIDRRADIFGLGVLLYVATTNKHPFRGENPAATVRSICSKDPPVAPSTFIPGYPPELEAVVMKALAKSPDQRFETAREMVDALDAVAAAVEGSFDSKVGDYLAQLFGSRPQERMNELRQAQLLADQRRGEGPSSHSSVSSLRAVSVAVDGASSFNRLEIGAGPTSLRASVVAAPSADTSSVSNLTSDARPKRRALGIVGALGGAAALLLLLILVLRGSPAGAPPPAQVGVSAATLSGSALPPAAKKSSEEVPRASASAMPPPPASARAGEETAMAPARNVRRGVVQPAPARAPVASAAPAPVAQPVETKKLNAWDDKNYGGRR